MTTPAGWYPDPEQPSTPGRPGTLRWWDGSAWTDDRTTAPDSSAAAVSTQKQGDQGSSPYQQPGYQQPGYQQPGYQQPGYQQPGYQQQQYGSYPAAGGWSAAPAAPGTYPAGGKATATPAGEPLAPLGGRLVAKIVDGIVIGILGALLAAPLWAGIFRAYGDFFNEVAANPQGEAATDPFYLFRQTDFVTDFALASLVGLAVSAVYTVVFLRVKGATPGKLMLGLRVRPWEVSPLASAGSPGGDREDGLSWGRAAGRWATEVLPSQLLSLWFLLDSLWCTWDGRKQTLHDKVAGTAVVSVRR